MTILKIQIPLTAENEELSWLERGAREAAGLEELEARIPGLTSLQSTIPTLGAKAIGGRLHLCLTLQRHPQLKLDLTGWREIQGRLLELDPSLLDQHTVSESLRTTQMLLARAVRREPEALRTVATGVEKQLRSKASQRLRRALGNEYTMQVFGEDERIQLPLLQPLAVHDPVHRFRLLVTKMRENSLFTARRIELLGSMGKRGEFALPKKEVYPCSRLAAASTYMSGQLLHESMELKRTVVVDGRRVVEVGTGVVVALQVLAVAREQAN